MIHVSPLITVKCVPGQLQRQLGIFCERFGPLPVIGSCSADAPRFFPSFTDCANQSSTASSTFRVNRCRTKLRMETIRYFFGSPRVLSQLRTSYKLFFLQNIKLEISSGQKLLQGRQLSPQTACVHFGRAGPCPPNIHPKKLSLSCEGYIGSYSAGNLQQNASNAPPCERPNGNTMQERERQHPHPSNTANDATQPNCITH
jgi:hypothetical protein